MANVVVLLTGGWGSDGWGETAFGQDTAPALPAALSGNVGSVTTAGTADVPTTGLQATGSVGTVDATGVSIVEVTGVSATGVVNSLRFDALVSFAGWGRGSWGESAWGSNVSVDAAQGNVGTVSVVTNVDVLPIGLSGTTAVGTVTVVEGSGVVVDPTGLSGTAEVGIPTISGGATVPTTGLEATTAVGVVTQKTNQNISVTAPAATAIVGSGVQVFCDANVSVSGLEASIPAQRVLVWGEEIPSPGTVWTEIAA